MRDTPYVLFRQHGGTSGAGNTAQHWGLHPLSWPVSCAALKHCLHILMLMRKKTGADVKHLVLFLFTCKEIIIILPFCSSVCHKKKSSWWRASSLVAWLDLHVAAFSGGEMVRGVMCYGLILTNSTKHLIILFLQVPLTTDSVPGLSGFH